LGSRSLWKGRKLAANAESEIVGSVPAGKSRVWDFHPAFLSGIADFNAASFFDVRSSMEGPNRLHLL
jgi:hypothetical protein